MHINNLLNIPYNMFFEGENFHKFHESIVICENFTLVIFNKIVLLKYFKVDKHMKEDKSLGNGNTILPSSTEQIFDTNHTILMN